MKIGCDVRFWVKLGCPAPDRSNVRPSALSLTKRGRTTALLPERCVCTFDTRADIRPEVGMGAIRFSLGRYTTIEDIDAVVDRLTDVLAAGSHLNAKPPGLVEGTGRCSL